MMQISVITLSLLNVAFGFVTNKQPYRLQPVHENFFLDIAEDPVANTPKQIFGEVAYKNFVAETVPNGLLARKYNIVERVRELKLLKLTAESGLLEVLEEKGLSLSKVEKLLPLADNLQVLPLANRNKDLLLSLAPLIIEPAPAILPIAVTLLKQGGGTYISVGLFLTLLGAYETTDNILLGIPLILTGLPAGVVGIVLNAVTGFLGGDVPTVTAKNDVNALSISSSSSNRPVAQKSRPVAAAKTADRPIAAPKATVKVSAPKVSTSTPKASISTPKTSTSTPKASSSAPKVASKSGGGQNGKRKVVKIN